MGSNTSIASNQLLVTIRMPAMLGDPSKRLCTPWHPAEIMDQFPAFPEICTNQKEETGDFLWPAFPRP